MGRGAEAGGDFNEGDQGGLIEKAILEQDLVFLKEECSSQRRQLVCLGPEAGTWLPCWMETGGHGLESMGKGSR